MSVRDHLREIYQTHGELVPKAVVEEARPPESPLHNNFEWDEHENSEKYLIIQAQRLIRSVKVTFTDAKGEQHEVREWVSIQRAEHPHEYKPIEEVVQDPFSYQLLVQRMERDIETLVRRYAHVQGFAEYVQSSLEKV